MVCKEEVKNIFPVVRDMFESKKIMKEKNNKSEDHSKYVFKEVHDEKMMYLLTQHLLVNRKYNQFLLCSCNWGAGVIDSEHECEIITHDDQIKLWEQSLRR